MKTSVKIVACMFFVIALLALGCESQQTDEAVVEPEEATVGNELIGVWKIAEITFADPQTPAVTEPETGIAIFTEKYVSYTGASAPRVELPEDPTDAQLAAAFKSFMAMVSSYEVEGNIITGYPVVGLNPNVTQDDVGTMEYKLEEGNLFITPKVQNGIAPENPYTVKLSRLE